LPQRIFLDSRTLQTLQDVAAFSTRTTPRLYNSYSSGPAKLETFRYIMQLAERATFQFAYQKNSLLHLERRGNARYLEWAYNVLDHWYACLTATDPAPAATAAEIDSAV
jgi:hypothetical protein